MNTNHLNAIQRSAGSLADRNDYLRLDMNENPISEKSPVIAEILKNIDPRVITSYPQYGGLYQMIAEKNGIQSEQLCITSGSDSAIKYIFDAFINEGDKILLTEPTFAMYPIYGASKKAQTVMLEYHKDLSFPFEEFLVALDDKSVRMAVIVNPNNPTGTVLDEVRLEILAKKAQEKNVLLVVDEAYFYFYPKTFIRRISEFENLVVLRSFSKMFGIAGLRVGFAAAHPDIIHCMKAVKPSYDVTAFSVFVIERLLAHSSYLDDMMKQLKDGASYIKSMMDESGTHYQLGEANFILIESPDPLKQMTLLRNRKILVGAGFLHSGLSRFIRVTIGGVDEMRIFWQAYSDTINQL